MCRAGSKRVGTVAGAWAAAERAKRDKQVRNRTDDDFIMAFQSRAAAHNAAD
jgi:hypothetical protein